MAMYESGLLSKMLDEIMSQALSTNRKNILANNGQAILPLLCIVDWCWHVGIALILPKAYSLGKPTLF